MQKHLRDYFIPYEGNSYKPSSLQTASIGVMSFLVLLSFTLANIHALLWISSDWLVSTILPAVIVDLTNEERGGEALGTLRRNATLDAAAKLKAEDMAKYSYFAHHSPSGVSPWYWFDEAGYSFIHAGENLAVHFTDSDEVVDAWMKSPGHRANILNGNYTEIGVGTAEGTYKGYPTVFVVQLFGTPAAKVAAAAPTPLPNPSPVPEPVVADVSTSQPQNDVTIEVTTEEEALETSPSSVPVVAPSRIETLSPEEVVEPEMPEVVTEEVPAVTEIDPIEGTVVYSDLATTSREGTPLILGDGNGDGGARGDHAGTTNFLARAATQPHAWLQMVYSVLAAFVAVSLVFSIFIEWRRQHPIQIAYGTGLLAAMALLSYIHTAVSSGVSIL